MQGNLVRFVVVAYSGTEAGIAAVRSHKLQPEIRVLTGCPTIFNTFFGALRERIEALCRAHPSDHPWPLGYDDCAALIAFAHGCPNNVPPIFHSRAGNWLPLFAGRSTSNVSAAFSSGDSFLVLDQRTQNLLKIREARKNLTSSNQQRWISAMLVLAAAEAGSQTKHDISARTHLNLTRVDELLALTIDARWLTDKGRLTPLGRNELARLRMRREQKPVLHKDINSFYYPTKLRAT